MLGPLATHELVFSGALEQTDLPSTDMFSLLAEQLIQVLETSGPEATSRVVEQLPRAERARLFEDALASGHPDSAGIADLRELVQPLAVSSAQVHPLAGLTRRGLSSKKRRRR